jgi:hypothetical protein
MIGLFVFTIRRPKAYLDMIGLSQKLHLFSFAESSRRDPIKIQSVRQPYWHQSRHCVPLSYVICTGVSTYPLPGGDGNKKSPNENSIGA